MDDEVRRLNELPSAEAERAFRACCGSREWARLMTASRPFQTGDDLYVAGDRLWLGLAAADWLEAFAAHPRIGERPAPQRPMVPHRSASSVVERDDERSSRHRGWSEDEQSGMRNATMDVSKALAAANSAYEAKFGHTFIVCASGKSGDMMLEMLRQRMTNDADTELRVAADEQRKITHLRLAKLLAEELPR